MGEGEGDWGLGIQGQRLCVSCAFACSLSPLRDLSHICKSAQRLPMMSRHTPLRSIIYLVHQRDNNAHEGDPCPSFHSSPRPVFVGLPLASAVTDLSPVVCLSKWDQLMGRTPPGRREGYKVRLRQTQAFAGQNRTSRPATGTEAYRSDAEPSWRRH